MSTPRRTASDARGTEPANTAAGGRRMQRARTRLPTLARRHPLPRVNPHDDLADSIIEHAEAMARLDPHLSARAWNEALAGHVRAIRVLAAAWVGAGVDRPFYKALKAASLRAEGVFVHTPGGRVEFLVDTRRGQHRFDLLSTRELREAHGG